MHNEKHPFKTTFIIYYILYTRVLADKGTSDTATASFDIIANIDHFIITLSLRLTLSMLQPYNKATNAS